MTILRFTLAALLCLTISNVTAQTSIQYVSLTNGGSATVSAATTEVYLDSGSATDTFSSFTLNLPQPTTGSQPAVLLSIKSTRPTATLTISDTSPDSSPVVISGNSVSTITDMSVQMPYGVAYTNSQWRIDPGGQTTPSSMVLDNYHPLSLAWQSGSPSYWNVEQTIAPFPAQVARPCGTPASGSGVVYYVNQSTGNDSNNGTSPSTSFATIVRAVNAATVPGDVVEVYNGTYTGTMSNSQGHANLVLATSGTATAPITYEAACGQTPVLSVRGSNRGIQISGASYIVINGFEVAGQSSATNKLKNSGIIMYAPLAGTVGHNVTIEFNKVHNFGGMGISVFYSDYISVLYNTTYENAYWDPAGASGINIGYSVNSDTNAGYHDYIIGNRTYLNMMLVAETGFSGPVDGNGIIIDTNNAVVRGTTYNFVGSTLVANNTSFFNGGSGMHACRSNNIDFFYNTAYDNDSGVMPSAQVGQIGSDCGRPTGIRAYNNIMAEDNGTALSVNGGGLTADYNLQYGSGSKVSGAHDVTTNPQWTSVTGCTTGLLPSNPTACVSAAQGNNFTLTAASPAINAADPAIGLTYPTDILGYPRPTNGGYDMGAYQYQ